MAGYNEDVLHLIAWFASCEPQSGSKTLKNLSRASRTARNATLPFIFRSVVVRRKWGSNALRGMTVVQPFVRSFTFTLRVKNEPGPKEIARRIALLADILRGCTNLERLVFNIDEDRADSTVAVIVSALRTSKLQLPSVHTLTAMAAALPLFLEHVCQHVTVLSVFLSESAPVTAATVAGLSVSPAISKLELRGSGWMSQHLTAIAILEKMPNVLNLTIDCRHLSLTQIENSLRLWESPPLKAGVQTLCLVDLTSLQPGFFVPGGHADCGRGSPPVNHLDRLAQRARDIFPRIQSLWVGETLIPGCEPIMDVPDQPLAAAFMRDMRENSRAWRGLREHDGAHFAIVMF